MTELDVLAHLNITWSSDEIASRMSSSDARVRRANCAFILGRDAEVEPGWPFQSERYMSILLEGVDSNAGASVRKFGADFVARDLAYPYLKPGAEMLIMEGPTVIGHATVVEVLKDREFVDRHPHPRA